MIKIIKDKLLFIFPIFLILYFILNLFGGNRGLFSYFEKKNFLTKLEYEKITLSQEIEELEKRTSDLFNPTMMTDIDKLIKLRKKIKKGNK